MRRSIRRNHVTAVPSSIACLDTETTPVPTTADASVCVQRLRLGVARYLRLVGDKATRREELVFRDKNTVLNWLLAKTDSRKPLWVWCHNAGFDLTVIGLWQLFESGELTLEYIQPPKAGAVRTDKPPRPRPGLFVAEDPPTIIRAYTRYGATIWFCDTLNWFFCPLSELGDALSLPKLPMPGEVAGDEDWTLYCRRDCEIVERSVLSLLSFVQHAGCGNFRPTCAGQSMSLFRHRCLDCPINYHDDERVKEFERRSYYGGRREVYWAGHVCTDGVYPVRSMAHIPTDVPCLRTDRVYHLDLTGAYPSVMANGLYPVSYLRTEYDVPIDAMAKRLEACAACAHVRIDCGQGSWPVKRSYGTIQATGSFYTHLCGPELIRALREGVVRSVGRVQWYTMDRPFRTFASECWRMRQEYVAAGNMIFGRMCKLLANSLHGKFGQRANQWEMVPGMCPAKLWGCWSRYDTATHEMTVYRSIGGQVQQRMPPGEADESFPLIAAYVSAYCRERMHALRWTAGLRHVLYEDADSMHVDQLGYDALVRAGELRPDTMGGLKTVHSASQAHYRGVQDYTLGDQVVRCGLSRQAVQDAHGDWHQVNFDRLTSTLSAPPAEGPITREVVKVNPTSQIRARVTREGWTEPILLRE